jgi:DNA polymerase III subunit delta'
MARKPEKVEEGPPWPLARTNTRLVGHEEAEGALLDSFNSGKLPHAWLISGPRGIGKATLAHRFARFVLAGDHGGGLFGAPSSLDVDLESPPVKRLMAGAHADMRSIEIGINERTGRRRTEIVIEGVRDLGQFMRLTPAEGGWRIAVIDAADEMNRAAANAVLKLLEEPPPRSVLLLVTHAPGDLFPTVRSRCRRLALKALPEETVADLLGRYIPDLPTAERTALARLADGSIGRALELSNAGGLELYSELFGLLDGLPRINVTAMHAFADRVSRRDEKGERDFRTVAFLLDWWLKTLVRQGAVGEAPESPLAGEAPLRRRLLQGAGLDRWMQVWEKVAHLFARADAVNLDRKQVVLGSLFAFQSAIR